MQKTTKAMNAEQNAHAKRLGERLREERILRGLTQTEVAEVLGVSMQQWQKYESGRNRLTVYRLEQICAFWGMPFTSFLQAHETKQKPDTQLRWSQLWERLGGKAKQELAMELVQSLVRSPLRE